MACSDLLVCVIFIVPDSERMRSDVAGFNILCCLAEYGSIGSDEWNQFVHVFF